MGFAARTRDGWDDPFIICCAAQLSRAATANLACAGGVGDPAGRVSDPALQRRPRIARKPAGRERLQHVRRGRAPRPRSAAFASTSGTTTLRASSCSGNLGARAVDRVAQDRPALRPRNGRAIDACGLSAAQVRARRSARRATVRGPSPARGSGRFCPPGSTFIHHPRLSSRRPSGKSIAPSSPSGPPATIAQ